MCPPGSTRLQALRATFMPSLCLLWASGTTALEPITSSIVIRASGGFRAVWETSRHITPWRGCDETWHAEARSLSSQALLNRPTSLAFVISLLYASYRIYSDPMQLPLSAVAYVQ
jgi:hypothetical protein